MTFEWRSCVCNECRGCARLYVGCHGIFYRPKFVYICVVWRVQFCQILTLSYMWKYVHFVEVCLLRSYQTLRVYVKVCTCRGDLTVEVISEVESAGESMYISWRSACWGHIRSCGCRWKYVHFVEVCLLRSYQKLKVQVKVCTCRGGLPVEVISEAEGAGESMYMSRPSDTTNLIEYKVS